MDIETFELAPGSWILAIGVERADRDIAGLKGKTTMPDKYQAAWSTDAQWDHAKTMTFTTMEEAEQYLAANRQQLIDAAYKL